MKNTPLIINRDVDSPSVSIRSLWDINADDTYINQWPNDRKLPYKENTLVVIYCSNGKGLVKLKDGSVIQSLGHCVLFINPKDIDSYWCDGFIWDLYWSEIFVDPIIATTVPKNETIILENPRHFELQFEQLLFMLNEGSNVHLQYAASLFNKLFYEWLLLAKTETQSLSNRRVNMVIEEMHQHLGDNWQVKSMAKFCSCSEQHLRKLFLAQTKLTPKHYYQKLKLDIAHGILKKGKKTVSQVAYDLGFSDAFHFSHAFKKQFNFPPSKVEPLPSNIRNSIQFVDNE